MPETKRPLKAFLYHAPVDRARVRDLYLRLINDGVDAWLVKEKLLPGRDWKLELHHAIREADAVIVCVSERFEQGEFRQKEARLALDATIEQLEEEICIIPVRLENCDLPAMLENWQPVDLFEKTGYDLLLQALQTRANEVGATLQVKDGSLPQMNTPGVKAVQVHEKKPVMELPGGLKVVEGAGILIERTAVRQSKPGRGTLLALLGFAVITMMALFGPAWIERSNPVTLTPEVKTTPTPRRQATQVVTPRPDVIPMPTLTWKAGISHIVFLIDTSGSMQGERIRNVKSAASRFVSRLGEDYLVSIMEFNTTVELRMASTRDHTAAIEAIRSITVDVSHNGACVEDAKSAAVQQASFPATARDPAAIVIVFTDVVVGENLGWNCTYRTASMNFPWNEPVPVFGLYLGEEFAASQFITGAYGQGSVRPAVSAKKIESTLLEVSEAAGLKLETEVKVFTPTTDAEPLSMVFVPSGEFLMGDHTVTLDSFWIDKTEVTNARYARCVEAGACNPPRSSRSHTRDLYFGNPEFDAYPVIYVSWEDASQHCAWAGGRLPTEAEWEKAARGADARRYPWGDAEPSGVFGLLNYQGQDTTEVGTYPDGASPYGALDMAGNVSEWVGDWFSLGYYDNPPVLNPLGPDTGEYRVWRGGSWANTSTDRVRTYSRTGNLPTDSSSGIGFRCARDGSP